MFSVKVPVKPHQSGRRCAYTALPFAILPTGENMQNMKKHMALFSFGGAGYGLLELLWRGRTHWSMILAGGICFDWFAKVAQVFSRRSLIVKAVIAALGVTAVELVFGILFNRILHKRVWDYSRLPLNVMGQICPQYTALWCLLGMMFVPLAARIAARWK